MDFLETSVYMVILRTCLYMEETGRQNSLERFPYLRALTGRLTEEAAQTWRQDAGASAARFWRIAKELTQGLGGETKKASEQTDNERSGGAGADPVLATALFLSLAAMQVPEFAAYLNYYTGNVVTLRLAFELEGIFSPGYPDVEKRIAQLRKVCRVEQKQGSQQYAAIEADDRLWSYLTGAQEIDRALFRKAEWFYLGQSLHPLFLWQELSEECAASGCGVIRIAGESGGRFLAKHTARLLEQDLLLVAAEKFKNTFDDEPDELVPQLLRELFLQKGILCIYGITAALFAEWQITEREFAKAAVLPFREADIRVILCTEAGIFGSWDGLLEAKCVTLPALCRKDREAVFSGFCELYELPFDCTQYSIRFRLSVGEIANAVRRFRSEGGGADRVGDQRFSRICYEILSCGEKKPLGEVLYPETGFSELMLSDDMQRTLGQICCSVREDYRIYEEWNLKRRFPYGRAVSVLLAGAPGTGKTLTAHALSGELGIPLYQVDLSHIMDKYIGETEKHLEQVFSYAEKTNMILFFDEADSLFGKRGEVTEGKDRYANMEVSYLLQRIERFEGIVVLATNFYHNIDKAFLRRMKYVLKYQEPDADVRRCIWESCLPEGLTPERLDLDYLAERFTLTGGMIKNVVYGACVRSLAEQEPLHMGHVLRAVKAEYEKLERPVGADVWGAYGYLME